MTHFSHLHADCENRDQLRNPTLNNRVWATFTPFTYASFLITCQYANTTAFSGEPGLDGYRAGPGFKSAQTAPVQMRAESSWHFTQPWPESITLFEMRLPKLQWKRQIGRYFVNHSMKQ